MICELVNMSDSIVVEHDDLAVLRAAALVLGGGHYALRRAEDGELVLPLFVLGGFDAWAARHGFDLRAVLTARPDEVADALDSLTYGNASARVDVRAAIAEMSIEAGRAWLRARNDERRTSLANIGACAAQIADRLRQRRPA